MPKLAPKNLIHRKTFNRIVELLESTNLPHLDVARQAGCCGSSTVKSIAEGTHYYQTGKFRVIKGPRYSMNLKGRRTRTRGQTGFVKVYLPTPEDIAALAKRYGPVGRSMIRRVGILLSIPVLG